MVNRKASLGEGRAAYTEPTIR